MNLSFHHQQLNALMTWHCLVNPESKAFRRLAWFVLLVWSLAVALVVLGCHSSRSLDFTETRGQSLTIGAHEWDSLFINPTIFQPTGNHNIPGESASDNNSPLILAAVRHSGQKTGAQLTDTTTATRIEQKDTALHSIIDYRFLVFLAAAAAVLFALLAAFLVLLRRL